MRWMVWLCVVMIGGVASRGEAAEPLRVGVFDVDASPPVGSPLAYDPTKGVESPLSCRGIVIVGADKPIVLCAVDWIGIGNDGHRVFREQLAKAAGTEPSRVSVHALHQHDAPRCDFSADEIAADRGVVGVRSDMPFGREVIRRAAEAVRTATQVAKPVTHVGLGAGIVEKVASNRRVMGPDGKVIATRYTATKNPELQAAPVGTIDPMLRSISFWNDETPVAVLTYYATHPQSYYRTGLANPDFPGIARNARQEATGVPHVHFNGAGGNIGAGKWNDGSKENRQVLADRVAEGMRLAWEGTQRTPITTADVAWTYEPVVLPAAGHLKENALLATLDDANAKLDDRWYAAGKLAWLRRCQTRDSIDIGCLRLGNTRVLHLPGELFVEYQLAAQKLRPDLFVAMAAYGDYAPGYIGTEVAYGEGGYETSDRVSKVAPEVERVLMGAIKTLLDVRE